MSSSSTLIIDASARWDTQMLGVVSRDPRIAPGVGGARTGARLVRRAGGLRQTFEKWGTGDTDWRLVSRPSLLSAQTADDVESVLRESISLYPNADGDEAASVQPRHLWVPRPANTRNDDFPADVVDLVGSVDLTAPNGIPRRAHLSLQEQEVVMRCHLNTAGWVAGSAQVAGTPPTYTDASWAQLWFIKLQTAPLLGGATALISYMQLASEAPTGAGWWFGFTESDSATPARPYLFMRDTAGVEKAFSAPDAGSFLDDAWHVVVFGRDSTANLLRIVTDANAWEIAEGTLGSLANASATFGVRDCRYDLAGATAQIAFGCDFTGAAAEAVLTSIHTTAICDGATGVIAI